MINHKENILKLKDGETYFIPIGEESGGEIWMKNDVFFLFNIPQYGGYPMFSGQYNKFTIDILLKTVLSWT